MIIKSPDELRQVNNRTFALHPMGLGIGVKMSPEDSAELAAPARLSGWSATVALGHTTSS